MDTDSFNKLRDLIYQESGIVLKEGKKTMLSARIAKRLRALNLEDERTYIEYLKNTMQTEVVNLLDVVSTNVTSFFRESHHFDILEQEFRGWLKSGQQRFRFWSAASSTGEEPYSMAVILNEVMRQHAGGRVDCRILATDISTQVLEKAGQGFYELDRVATIKEAWLKRYFRKTVQAGMPGFQVSSDLQNMILYKRMNLSTPPFVMKGPMDAIFCRNVMIYFDDVVRTRMIDEFRRLLKPDGLLMLGHSETLKQQNVHGFDRAGPSVYRKTHSAK